MMPVLADKRMLIFKLAGREADEKQCIYSVESQKDSWLGKKYSDVGIQGRGQNMKNSSKLIEEFWNS